MIEDLVEFSKTVHRIEIQLKEEKKEEKNIYLELYFYPWNPFSIIEYDVYYIKASFIHTVKEVLDFLPSDLLGRKIKILLNILCII